MHAVNALICDPVRPIWLPISQFHNEQTDDFQVPLDIQVLTKQAANQNRKFICLFIYSHDAECYGASCSNETDVGSKQVL